MLSDKYSIYPLAIFREDTSDTILFGEHKSQAVWKTGQNYPVNLELSVIIHTSSFSLMNVMFRDDPIFHYLKSPILSLNLVLSHMARKAGDF